MASDASAPAKEIWAVTLWICLSFQIVGWSFALHPWFSVRPKESDWFSVHAFLFVVITTGVMTNRWGLKLDPRQCCHYHIALRSCSVLEIFISTLDFFNFCSVVFSASTAFPNRHFACFLFWLMIYQSVGQ